LRRLFAQAARGLPLARLVDAPRAPYQPESARRYYGSSGT